MRLAFQRAMILSQWHLQPLQLVTCYQWRTMGSHRLSCSLPSVLLKFRFTTFNILTESNIEAVVHCSTQNQTPEPVSCGEWLGRKVGQSRCRASTTAGARVIGLEGAEKEDKTSQHESDDNPLKLHPLMASPQRPQKKKATYEGIDMRKDDTKDIEDTGVTEENDNIEAQGNDWCAYILLSNDKRKTYLGVTSNLTRRLRQHNGELVGGAKSARGGRPWSLVCSVWGVSTRSEACQFEWRLRNFSKAYLAVDGTISEEVPTNYQCVHVVLRRWAAFKKVQETMDQWKHLEVQWH